MLSSDGEPLVVAAAFAESPPSLRDAASSAAWQEVSTRSGAFDLGDPSVGPALRDLATRQQFGAAAPVLSREGEALAVLWLGGPQDPAGRVRPRVLAALDQAAQRLRAPASAAATLARLSHLDEEVYRLARLASLGDLLAEVVHEIRNPLVSIKTFLQLLPERGDDPDFKTRFRKVAEEEVLRLERLLDSLIQHARPRARADAGEASEVGPVLAAITGLLAQRARDREASLERELAPGLPRVAIQEDALRQVVLNLALNAIDASPAGGAVRFVARASSAGVELLVDDEGPGVPEAERERIFEPFVSSGKQRSAGLGLAISRRLVEEAGGTILLERAPRGGARFRVTLPPG
jgi:signal transduction histidine kinase